MEKDKYKKPKDWVKEKHRKQRKRRIKHQRNKRGYQWSV